MDAELLKILPLFAETEDSEVVMLGGQQIELRKNGQQDHAAMAVIKQLINIPNAEPLTLAHCSKLLSFVPYQSFSELHRYKIRAELYAKLQPILLRKSSFKLPFKDFEGQEMTLQLVRIGDLNAIRLETTSRSEKSADKTILWFSEGHMIVFFGKPDDQKQCVWMTTHPDCLQYFLRYQHHGIVPTLRHLPCSHMQGWLQIYTSNERVYVTEGRQKDGWIYLREGHGRTTELFNGSILSNYQTVESHFELLYQKISSINSFDEKRKEVFRGLLAMLNRLKGQGDSNFSGMRPPEGAIDLRAPVSNSGITETLEFGFMWNPLIASRDSQFAIYVERLASGEIRFKSRKFAGGRGMCRGTAAREVMIETMGGSDQFKVLISKEDSQYLASDTYENMSEYEIKISRDGSDVQIMSSRGRTKTSVFWGEFEESKTIEGLSASEMKKDIAFFSESLETIFDLMSHPSTVLQSSSQNSNFNEDIVREYPTLHGKIMPFGLVAHLSEISQGPNVGLPPIFFQNPKLMTGRLKI